MIAVSAGHHFKAPGAVHESMIEYVEMTHWAGLLVQRLGADRSVLCPPGVLQEKVAFINRVNPVLAVELHLNAAQDADGFNVGRGSETLYHPNSRLGKLAAEVVQDQLGSVLTPNRGVKEGWYRQDRKRGPIFFLARTTCPAIVVELEFIHHVEEIKACREHCSDVLASAVLEAAQTLTNTQRRGV